MPPTWTFLIAVHASAASYALLFGAVNLLRRKGGRAHRILGRIWAIAMYTVVLTSFGVRTIDGGFNLLHALSALTFCTLTVGLWAAVKGNVRVHRGFMTGSYFGLVGAFVGVIAVPSRRVPQLALHDLPLLLVLLAGLLATTAVIIGCINRSPAGRPVFSSEAVPDKALDG